MSLEKTLNTISHLGPSTLPVVVSHSHTEHTTSGSNDKEKCDFCNKKIRILKMVQFLMVLSDL